MLPLVAAFLMVGRAAHVWAPAASARLHSIALDMSAFADEYARRGVQLDLDGSFETPVSPGVALGLVTALVLVTLRGAFGPEPSWKAPAGKDIA